MLFTRILPNKNSKKPLTKAPKAAWPQFSQVDRNIFAPDPMKSLRGMEDQYLGLVKSPAFLLDVSKRLHAKAPQAAAASSSSSQDSGRPPFRSAQEFAQELRRVYTNALEFHIVDLSTWHNAWQHLVRLDTEFRLRSPPLPIPGAPGSVVAPEMPGFAKVAEVYHETARWFLQADKLKALGIQIDYSVF